MKTSIKKLAERIELDNERFNNLSKAEKRVKVARDCLERIALKQFNITTGSTIALDWHNPLMTKSIKEVINSKKMPECQVCAKGGLFMSYVGRVNECKFEDIEDCSALESTEMQKLQEIFNGTQLNLIEAAFEGVNVCELVDSENFDEDLFNSAENYRNKLDELFDDYVDSDNVLKSICKNIIKNKGEFIPTDIVNPNARIK